jgi:hypothetical protein
MKRGQHVTDHAILRYLERAHGIDINAVRHMIADTVREAAQAGASGVRHGGLAYRLKDGVVVTVAPISQEPLSGAALDPELAEDLPRKAVLTRRERARLAHDAQLQIAPGLLIKAQLAAADMDQADQGGHVDLPRPPFSTCRALCSSSVIAMIVGFSSGGAAS